MDNMQPMMGDPMAGGQPQPVMGGGMPPPQQVPAEQEANPQDDQKKYLAYALQEANLAKKLSKNAKGKKLLEEMGQEILQGYKDDEASRTEWLKNNKEWLKLALMITKTKSFPWPDASNVKYPLLATAAMQFSARAYPALVPSDGKVVRVKILQKNASPDVWDSAQRVSNHMSYQLLQKIPNWEEDMDKLLMSLAISGIMFKKTYHSSMDNCHYSEIVYPENLCVNYYAKSIEAAYRKTEILEYTHNEYLSKVRNDEEFLDVDLPQASSSATNINKEHLTAPLEAPPSGKSTPHVFLACHTYWDLDDDGYEEPYIITIHRETGKVVRIIARWDLDSIKRNSNDEIVYIKPIEYFTTFTFIPNPDGSIYGLGFGLLLGSLNNSIDTLINQLVDAGTLANMPSGFIGKGLRLKIGETHIAPGQFRVVNATGEDLAKNVFVFPFKEPQQVLFTLLQMLITAGNQLASIAEIFVGKMPGQNTPATTTQETIQQGMAVFTAIYKRVYRGLDAEFKKLYRLNSICPDILEEESQLSGIQMQSSDYDLPDWIIAPGADPVGDSSTVKMSKLQQVGQLLQLGTINPQVFTERLLSANEIPNYQELMQQPPPPQPDPKAEAMKVKAQVDQQKGEADIKAKMSEVNIKERLAQLEEASRQSKLDFDRQKAAMELKKTDVTAKIDMVKQAQNSHFQARKAGLDLQHKAAQHEMAMQQKDAAFTQKQQMAKKTAKEKPKTKG